MASSPASVVIESTDKAHNLMVELAGLPTLDEMEATLASVAAEMGLGFSHITKLGAKRYSGNRHWHLKPDAKTNGCLDITYWPSGPAMWITMRLGEPTWVHTHGAALGPALEAAFKA